MRAAAATPRLRLRQLRLLHGSEPGWPGGAEPLLPGVLEVTSGQCSHLLFCPDVVTLLTSLWQRLPYGARGQMVRITSEGQWVRLESAWGGGSKELASMGSSDWHQQLTTLAGQAADVLAPAGEQSLLGLLTPVLAGAEPRTRRPPH